MPEDNSEQHLPGPGEAPASHAGHQEAEPAEAPTIESLLRSLSQAGAGEPETVVPEDIDSLLDDMASVEEASAAPQTSGATAAGDDIDAVLDLLLGGSFESGAPAAAVPDAPLPGAAQTEVLQAEAATEPPSDDPNALLDLLAQADDEPAAPLAADGSIEAVLGDIDAELSSVEAEEQAPSAAVNDLAQQVVFQLAGTNYAVPITEVVEMSTVPRTTLLPNVPHFVRGVTNLRGEVLAVIDLRLFLGLDIHGDAVRERMLVVRPPGSDAVAGLIVESVRGLARTNAQQLRQPAGPVEDPVVPYLAGVTEFEDQVLHALDLRKLFLAPEIVSLSIQ
jgi:purine-binding chemotaxis protein CheW